MLVIIGTEKYLRDIYPFDKIIDKIYEEGWVEELNHFDLQLREYLPKETKKFIDIDEIGGGGNLL